MGEESESSGVPILPLLVLGAVLTGYVAFVYAIGIPKVGVIKIDGAIMEKEKADKINEMLRFARDRRDIRAVVLEINSPGGIASASEDIYLTVLGLREKKPVVASIHSLGASGAYFIASASDYIFAKTASNVGSIGVRAVLPRRVPPDEDTLTTGPLKKSGFAREDFVRDLEIVKEAFLRSVLSQRGDRIKIEKEELSKAGIYIGVEAKRFGLVDELGSNTDAYSRAASFAGLRKYRVLDINKELSITLDESTVFLVNESRINRTNTAPAYYFIYMEPG
ncbi:MAG: S49 family peptidase [Candidatus Hydrothermarchaeales archaeon]